MRQNWIYFPTLCAMSSDKQERRLGAVPLPRWKAASLDHYGRTDLAMDRFTQWLRNPLLTDPQLPCLPMTVERQIECIDDFPVWTTISNNPPPRPVQFPYRGIKHLTYP